MSTTTPSGFRNVRLSIEPQRTLLTPSASPSLPPPDRPPTKRPRLRSTPSSSKSATPSTSNESSSSADVNSARRASTLRVLNVWAQLAERYNKRLDEDDIVDLYSGAIIKDRGVVKAASRDYHIGHFAQPDGDQDYPDPDQDQEESEQDDDDNELNALPPSEATTDDDAPISKKELLRGVPPLSATTDTEDLREFLEAEKKRRELAGDDDDDDDDLSPQQLSAIRKALEEEAQKDEAATADQAQDTAGAAHYLERQVDPATTRPSTHVQSWNDESEDELALWTHDESTAVYPVARDESEQDAREVDQAVVELTESDSDEEFKAILTRPPRSTPVSPLSVSYPEEAQQLLQSPPDSERGRGKSRIRSKSKIKSKIGATPKSESRPSSPRRREVILAHKRKPKETGTVSSDDSRSDQEVITHISPARKGKDKEVSSPVDDNPQEKTPKSLGVAARGRKRKRIVSSTSGGPSGQSSAKTKSGARSHGKLASPSSIPLFQLDGLEPTLDEDVSTPVRFAGAVPGSSSFSSVSKTQHSISSAPVYHSLEPEPVQPTSHDHNFSRTPAADPPIALTPYSRRHPSYPPPIFSSPDQGTPGPSLAGHLPPPMDPVQTQQAHYLLAQAMQQLSYLISASMPPYTAYAPNPGQPWHPPPHAAYNTPIHHHHHPPPLHTVYGTPVHYPSHFHGTRPYYTPSSNTPSSGLPPSSPIQSSVSPPVEERRARSRGRSKSRGRRVSFKLDSEEVVSREHNIPPELHHNVQKNRKQTLEVRREREEEKAAEFDDGFRLEDRGSSPQDVVRGRTPGPPGRKKSDLSRSRSLSRRQ